MKQWTYLMAVVATAACARTVDVTPLDGAATQVPAPGSGSTLNPEPPAANGSSQLVVRTQVSASMTASCDLAADGHARCWGENFGLDPTAVDVPAGTVAIALGHEARCALTIGGQVYCWG